MKNQSHRIRRAFGALAVAVLAVAAASCLNDESAITPEIRGGELFDRYVSLGNSITSGFQSGGINAQTQAAAYPVQLAAKAQAYFNFPALASPGCPPLLVGPLTTERESSVPCALRAAPIRAPIQNLAVPGADASDLTDPLGTGTVLTTLVLGGRTAVQAMQDADPSLVSVWIGNNDALGAAASGVVAPTTLTPLADFQAEYDAIVAGINATDAQDAILIGVINAPMAAPALQPGAYFWAIAQNPPPGLPPISVSNNCAPFDLVGDPNPLAFRMISFQGIANAIGAQAFPISIDCQTGVAVPGDPADYLLDETEVAAIATRVAEFNGYIQQQADANGWIYIDPLTLLGPGLQDPDLIRKCQALATATNAQEFAAAVATSCPVNLDETFFGTWISVDGVHPSSEAHAAVANALAAALNSVHGLGLPAS